MNEERAYKLIWNFINMHRVAKEKNETIPVSLIAKDAPTLLLEALNVLRSGRGCVICQENKKATRKLRRTLTDRNKQIKDLQNRLIVFEEPRHGLYKFREPECISDETDVGPHDFEEDFCRGAFTKWRME